MHARVPVQVGRHHEFHDVALPQVNLVAALDQLAGEGTVREALRQVCVYVCACV